MLELGDEASSDNVMVRLQWNQKLSILTGLQDPYHDLAIVDGKVTCPACGKRISVGMGGRQNLVKQHRPGESKACQRNLKKKNKTGAHQQSQLELPSFFMKQPKVFVPPAVPMPTPVIAYAMESELPPPATHAMEVTPRQVPLASNTHAVNVLAALEKAIERLPVLPDASESDEIAVFSENVPMDLAKEEAWEYLDPMLNRFLGFNRTSGSIYNELRGGERGLSAMVQYLKDFVHHYEIDGALLEGKVQRLVKVIQTQCVTMTKFEHSL